MKLKVSSLSFAYDEKIILDRVSFESEAGEIIAVLGPNGVGKSTMFRCLLGFLKSKDGLIQADGKNIESLSKKELAGKIAYIPQFYNPAFDHTVMDTVLMGITGQLDIFAQPGASEKEAAYKILEGLGIAELAQRGITKISGGERQLVLLARALFQNAQLLVMDEPTASLDYGNSFKVMEKICELKDKGYTVIFSTHEPNQALRYATRVLALKDGKLIADGVPPQVLTPQILKSLYGIDVAVSQLKTGEEDFYVCLPYKKCEI